MIGIARAAQPSCQNGDFEGTGWGYCCGNGHIYGNNTGQAYDTDRSIKRNGTIITVVLPGDGTVSFKVNDRVLPTAYTGLPDVVYPAVALAYNGDKVTLLD